MNKINNYNYDGLCCESSCDKRYTQFIVVHLHGLNIILSFCDSHAKKYDLY